MRPSDGSDHDDLRILQSLLVDDANATLQPEQALKDSNLRGLKTFFSLLLTRACLLESLRTCYHIVYHSKLLQDDNYKLLSQKFDASRGSSGGSCHRIVVMLLGIQFAAHECR